MAKNVISGSILLEFEVWATTNQLDNGGQIKLSTISKPQFYHLQKGDNNNSQPPRYCNNFKS